VKRSHATRLKDLELAADGQIYGGGRGQGLFRLGADDRPIPVLNDFYGLFARSTDGTMALAPADAQGRWPQLEILSPDHHRTPLAALGQINALAWHGRSIVVADGSAIRSIELDGTTRGLAEEVGKGIQGLAIGPNGPVLAAFEDRAVVEVAPDDMRRVLLRFEPPWAPTDVTFHGATLYVVEYAAPSQGWKGPRVRGSPPGKKSRRHYCSSKTTTLGSDSCSACARWAVCSRRWSPLASSGPFASGSTRHPRLPQQAIRRSPGPVSRVYSAACARRPRILLRSSAGST
jgi:hypothetical protein